MKILYKSLILFYTKDNISNVKVLIFIEWDKKISLNAIPINTYYSENKFYVVYGLFQYKWRQHLTYKQMDVISIQRKVLLPR